MLYVDKKLPPRFELGLVDSKSTVLTATPREQNFPNLDSNQGLDPKKTPTLPTELSGKNDINNIYILLLYKNIYAHARARTADFWLIRPTL